MQQNGKKVTKCDKFDDHISYMTAKDVGKMVANWQVWQCIVTLWV